MSQITMRIDGTAVQVEAGTPVIRAAESIGIAIPRFCDHPLLDPVAACRQCMVEVPDAGNGRGLKPQPACALAAADNMVVQTGATSAVARQAQQGMLEFLLINHPLDCPVCDKGGECPLQNQALADGRGQTRYDGVKRTYPKPVALSQMLLLDRERCVLCQRCTRFGEQISGDVLLSLAERGAKSQISRGGDDGIVSYFAGNLVQICPVGALTSTDYRFQARPFDIVSVTTTCEQCAAGCSLRVDQRHGDVRRRLAADVPDVNEEWNCDKGRFAFHSTSDRLTTPLLRGEDGQLRPVAWPQALTAAAAGLKALGGQVGVLPGGRLTMENALAYARFAALVLGSPAIDARTRRGAGAGEAAFLARQWRGAKVPVTYTDLENARRVVLVGFEPEDECPMIYLRLRKAVRRNGCQVVAIAPVATPGSRKLSAKLIVTAPGDEAMALGQAGIDDGTIVLAGERAGAVPGLLDAIEDAVNKASARLAWVPRRAGEAGAALVGCLPGWPGDDPAARAGLAAAWGVAGLPAGPGLGADEIWAAAARGEMGLLVGGVDIDDLDVTAARAGLQGAPFVVSLEQRPSAVTALADVVLPVALLTEQAGTFRDWTGTDRLVTPVVAPQPMTDRRVLGALARRMGCDLGLDTLEAARQIIAQVEAAWAALPPLPSPAPAHPVAGATHLPPVLATWRTLLAGSRCLDGATALQPRPVQAVAGPGVAEALDDGQMVVVTGPDGDSLTAPLKHDAAAARGVLCLPDAPWLSGSPLTVGIAVPSDNLSVTGASQPVAAGQAGQGGER